MYNDNFRPTRLYMRKIENENKELKSRIDKAIEYIEENCIDDEFEVNLTKKEREIKKVLDILKGSDES